MRARLVGLGLLPLIIACRRDLGTAPSSLVTLAEEPASDNCASGGVAIHTGTDTNGDGVLGADEITQTEYVCDAEAPPDALVDVAPEPSGANCAYGGTAVTVGTDTDRNGTLDASEITDTQYVCNPAPGQGALVDLVQEPPGDNCAYGGLAVSTGDDANNDGTLSADEIAHTEFLCADAGMQIDVTDLAPGGDCATGGYLIRTGRDADGDGSISASEAVDTAQVCNGNDGVDAPIALFRLDDEPAGPQCANGGIKVNTGLDDNGDGVLSDPEVDARTYVCDGVDGADGLQALVATIVEPAGANCATGGLHVESGMDVDANGLLDPSEVTNGSYVCDGVNGTNATPSLVRLDAEAAGANCATGGTAVRSGVDDNKDGVLQNGEVDTTSYVCSGKDGSAGTSALVVTDAEAAGPNCVYGGTRIRGGQDTNKNGTLDTAEVTSTQYACNASANVLPVLAYTAEGTTDISHAATANSYQAIPDLDLQFDVQGSYLLITEFELTLNPGSNNAWAAFRLDLDGNPDSRSIHVQPSLAGEERHVTLFRLDQVTAGTHRVRAYWGEGGGTVTNNAGNALGVWSRRMSVVAIPMNRGVQFGYVQGTADTSPCHAGTSPTASWTDIPNMSAAMNLAAPSTVLTLADMNFVGADSTWATWRLTMDGVGDPTTMSLQPIGGTDEDNIASLFRLDALPAGNHTAAMQWGYGAGSICNPAGTSLWTRRIGWVAFPTTMGAQSMYLAPATNAIHTPTPGAYTTIPNLEGTINLPGQGYNIALMTVLFNYDPAVNGGWIAARTNVDGVSDPRATHTNPSNNSEDNEMTAHRVTWLAGGEHTFKAEWGEGAGNGYSDATQIHWTRRLGVVAIPVVPPQ